MTLHKPSLRRYFFCILCCLMIQSLNAQNDSEKGKTNFSGTIKYKTEFHPHLGFIEVDTEIVVKYDKKGNSLTYNIENGDTVAVTYANAQEALMYSFAGKKVFNFSSLKPQKEKWPFSKKTKETKLINGLLCRKVILKTKEGQVEGHMWVAKDFNYAPPICPRRGEFNNDDLIVECETSMHKMVALRTNYENIDFIPKPACIKEATSSFLSTRSKIEEAKLIEQQCRETIKDIDIRNESDINFGYIKQEKQNFIYLYLWSKDADDHEWTLAKLDSIQHEYRDQGLEIVTIAIDEKIDQKNWQEIIQDYPNLKRHYVSIHGKDNPFCIEYNFESFPQFMLIDRLGRVAMTHAPSPHQNELRELFSEL